MKLSTWAKKNGIAYQTAYSWFKNGKLPISATQTPTGTILVEERPASLREAISKCESLLESLKNVQ